MKPVAAGQLVALLLAAANANREAAAFLTHGCACCGHGEATHDLDRRGRRTRCSVATGPRAVPCGCTGFEPVIPTDLESAE